MIWTGRPLRVRQRAAQETDLETVQCWKVTDVDDKRC